MGTTASGFIYPDVGYTSGVRQAIEDLADSAETVIQGYGIPRFADAAARNAAIPAPAAGRLSALDTERFIRRATGSGTTWKPYGTGLFEVIPTSVAGTNTSLSGATVTTAAATSASVNGCFTSDFDHYVIVWENTRSSAGGDVQMRLRAGGTDNTTVSSYIAVRNFVNGTTNSAATTTTTFWTIDAGASTPSISRGRLELFSPALAVVTSGISNAHNNGSYFYTGGLHHTATSAFDGFTFIPAAGTLTGTIRVYGYNNE